MKKYYVNSITEHEKPSWSIWEVKLFRYSNSSEFQDMYEWVRNMIDKNPFDFKKGYRLDPVPAAIQDERGVITALFKEMEDE